MRNSIKPAEKIKAGDYPDVGDNVYANVATYLDMTCDGGIKQWFIPLVDINKHSYAKIIVCGKEWCEVCGKKGSMAHNRRYVRWLPKIMEFESMRYLIFTIPEELRTKYRTKGALTDLGRRCQEMLKRHGYERGLRRWHWFGEKIIKWHPHLNVIVEGKYLERGELENIKRDWAAILGTEKHNVRISFKPTPADMAGCLYYVTRATFLDYSWDIEMAMELRGFRNMVVWGKNKWSDDPVWSLSPAERQEKAGEDLDVKAIENIIEHKCPRCGEHLIAGTALPVKLLELQEHKSLGAGYYEVLTSSGPPRLSDDVKKKLERLRMEWLIRCAFSDKNKNRLDDTLYYYLN